MLGTLGSSDKLEKLREKVKVELNNDGCYQGAEHAEAGKTG